MAEALATDQARAVDLLATLRGVDPAAEANLRAIIDGTALEPEEAVDDDGPGPVGATITDLAGWVENANRLLGGG